MHLNKRKRKIIRQIFNFKQRLKIYWRLECLNLALSSPDNNVRDKNSETTANSFDAYLKKLNENEKLSLLEKLKSNLGQNSCQEIDNFLERQAYIFRHNIFDQKKFINNEEKEEQVISNKESIKIEKEINKFFFKHYSIESFYGLSGLRWLNEEKKEKLKEGVALDIGAFDGDSALAFHKYLGVKKIYAFEPEHYNFKRLNKNSQVLGDNIIIPINLGVSDKEKTAKISRKGAMSKINDNIGEEEIKITSIDKYLETHNLEDISLIKMDIEGEEMNAIKGSVNTIKKYKPTLAISIYHNPSDFFEIKPMLKDLVPEYKFIVKKANPYSLNHELMLLAYT